MNNNVFLVPLPFHYTKKISKFEGNEISKDVPDWMRSIGHNIIEYVEICGIRASFNEITNEIQYEDYYKE